MVQNQSDSDDESNITTDDPTAAQTVDETRISNTGSQEDREMEARTISNSDNNNTETGQYKLYKSPLVKGYITTVFASIINYNAALNSNNPIANISVPASPTQQRYAEAVALVSTITGGFLMLVHLDRFSPLQSIWKKIVAPKSKIELVIIILLLLWWLVATIVQTSVRGIAGDGKEQYNLYYSSWVCCWTMCWTLERKLCDFGWSSLRSFITSWPYRAPGWIAILCTCFFTLFWYLDLFLNTAQRRSDDENDVPRVAEPLQPFYDTIPTSQYQLLLFVAAFTMLPSAVFVLVEIFRETNEGDVKGPMENILEGFFLMLLVIAWIPSVIVATTPGGFASLVGNAYFFTWVTVVFVMETFLWFLHDFRGGFHSAIQEKEREYKQHQQQVLEKTRRIAAKHGLKEAVDGRHAMDNADDNDMGNFYHDNRNPQDIMDDDNDDDDERGRNNNDNNIMSRTRG